MFQRRVLFILQVRALTPSWRGAAVLLTWALYVVGVLLAFASGGAWSGVLLVASLGAAALDWSSFWTLGGRVSWARLGTWARIGLGLVYLSCLVAPLFVLVPHLRQMQARRRAVLAGRQTDVARMERELGL